MTALELKPCPFCGNAAAEPWFDDDAERAEVYCTKCSGTATSGYVSWLCDDADRKEAISAAVTAWNTRADIADARVAAAYEAAARWHNENSEHDQHGLDYSALVGIPISNAAELALSVEMHTYSADHIRALTPADAKAALEAVRREARAEALREAADLARENWRSWDNATPIECDATACEYISDAILAMIDNPTQETQS